VYRIKEETGREMDSKEQKIKIDVKSPLFIDFSEGLNEELGFKRIFGGKKNYPSNATHVGVLF
jgi:hypothetical protein